MATVEHDEWCWVACPHPGPAIQRGSCDRCAQGVMDDGPNGPGNDHLYGRCSCPCHNQGGTDG